MTTTDTFGAPPSAAGTTTYLGVPNGYQYQSAIPNPGVLAAVGAGAAAQAAAPRPPLYLTGSEYSIASLPPDQIARLQQAMAAAGLIGASTNVRVGIADSATVSAYKSLLSFANVNGADVNTALQILVDHPQSTPAQTVQLPSPVDEDAALRTKAQNVLGHDPTEQQLDGFRSFYNDAYTAGQTTSTATNPADTTNPDGTPNATGTGDDVTPIGANATMTQPPTMDNAAGQYLQQNDSQGIGQQNVATKYSTLLSILTGGGK